jgi:hypothetical protein
MDSKPASDLRAGCLVQVPTLVPDGYPRVLVNVPLLEGVDVLVRSPNVVCDTSVVANEVCAAAGGSQQSRNRTLPILALINGRTASLDARSRHWYASFLEGFKDLVGRVEGSYPWSLQKGFGPGDSRVGRYAPADEQPAAE